MTYTLFDYIRLDNFLVPMPCTGNSSCFPHTPTASHHNIFDPEKPTMFSCAPDADGVRTSDLESDALSTELPPHPMCAVFSCFHIPSAVRPTLLRQIGMGSLTCAQIWVRAVHTNGGQVQTSLHKSWPGWPEKLLFLTMPRQGIEPRVFGFEFRRTNH